MKRLLLALAIPATVILAGCSSSPAETDVRPSATSTFNALDGLAIPTATSAANGTVAPKVTATKPASPDIYGVTPDGLTTAVNVPVLASPAEMHQGCIEAKAALEVFGGDVEATLALMQSTAEFMQSTTETTWATAPPEKQAEILQAIHAAANGGC